MLLANIKANAFFSNKVVDCKIEIFFQFHSSFQQAVIAQLGERQTEDLKVPGSIPGRGNFVMIFY